MNRPTYRFPSRPLPHVAWYWHVICFLAALAPVAGSALWED